MSYKLTAMKLPTVFAIASIYYSAVGRGYMHRGSTSTSPNSLNSNAFPSITGRPAMGPISPKPRMAVPSETMAANRLVLL